MKAANNFCVVLLFGFALSFKVVTCFAASKYIQPLTAVKVTISNLQTNDTLFAHCKSKDDDLGEQAIGIGNIYSWKFKVNFTGTTLYWCNFHNKIEHASFEVFWRESKSWLSDRCNDLNCLWVAKQDGFYLYNALTKQLEFIHPWERGSS